MVGSVLFKVAVFLLHKLTTNAAILTLLKVDFAAFTLHFTAELVNGGIGQIRSYYRVLRVVLRGH